MSPSNGIADSWATEFGTSLAGQRVLVTGAAGFIGRHLSQALVALGADVHACLRTKSGSILPAGCRVWAVDLTDRETLAKVFAQVRPQLVFHLAGLVTARQDSKLVMPTLRDNLFATVHLLLSIAEIGCGRAILLGSAEELFLNEPEGAPTSPYAATKAASGLYARMFHHLYGSPVVVLRPFLTYGPGQDQSKVIPHTIRSLLRDESPRIGSGSRICDFVYVMDVVRGLLHAAARRKVVGKTVDLGSGSGKAIQEVVEILVKLTGSKARPILQPIPDRKGERPQIADARTAKKLLGWEPLWSLEDGLAETVAWYRATLEKNATYQAC